MWSGGFTNVVSVVNTTSPFPPPPPPCTTEKRIMNHWFFYWLLVVRTDLSPVVFIQHSTQDEKHKVREEQGSFLPKLSCAEGDWGLVSCQDIYLHIHVNSWPQVSALTSILLYWVKWALHVASYYLASICITTSIMGPRPNPEIVMEESSLLLHQ